MGEVDCRLVRGGNRAIAVMSVYDGPDGTNAFPFHFGPRTWGGNGVGYQNLGLQDYPGGKNPGRGEDPFAWSRLRIVRRPGGVFDTAYNRLDGSGWIEVRNGEKPPVFQQVQGKRIALGYKQGDGDGQIEFKNLVVHAGGPSCATVDLAKLRMDQPNPAATGIEVNGDRLILMGRGRLDLWTHSRDGAPVAWLDAPADETYTFEVDCRLVRGGNRAIAVMTVYDGPDGTNAFPFHFGPRTWGGNGVGYQNLGLQDYPGGKNPGRGEDPFAWSRLRIVRRPGGVFDTAYNRLDGSGWIEVRSGEKPPIFHQVQGTRIALGYKQGDGDGQIEFKNLVVHAGDPLVCEA